MSDRRLSHDISSSCLSLTEAYDIYMYWWIRSPLFQVMVWWKINYLNQWSLETIYWTLSYTFLVKSESKHDNFLLRKCIWKFSLDFYPGIGMLMLPIWWYVIDLGIAIIGCRMVWESTINNISQTNKYWDTVILTESLQARYTWKESCF